jgi:hypothetical protein
MTKISRIAALAGLVATLGSPAFANDDSAQALAQDSGRYFAATVQSNSFVPSKAEQVRAITGVNQDFQLSGR